MTSPPAPITDPAEYGEQFAKWVADNYLSPPDDLLQARAAYLAPDFADFRHYPPHKFADASETACWLCHQPINAGKGATLLGISGASGSRGSWAVNVHRPCARLIEAEQDRAREPRP